MTSVLFSRFIVFKNSDGEFEVADPATEVVLTDRFSGRSQKAKISEVSSLFSLLGLAEEEKYETVRKILQLK